MQDGARLSQPRHEKLTFCSRTAATWEFPGAEVGIRIRDPHLDKKTITTEGSPFERSLWKNSRCQARSFVGSDASPMEKE